MTAKPKVPKPPTKIGGIVPTRVALKNRIAVVEAESRAHLEPQELKALWAALEPDPFWRGYFGLQYHFGRRCSEIALLLKEDVSLVDHTILIKRLKKRNEEGYDLHPYKLPPRLTGLLEAVRPCVPKENPWFFGSWHRAQAGDRRVERTAAMRVTGERWRAVSRSSAQLHFQAAAEAAHIPANLRHTHVLRHTRATLLFAGGATTQDVQYLLGHTDPAMTQKYIGWAANLKTRVENLLEDE